MPCHAILSRRSVSLTMLISIRSMTCSRLSIAISSSAKWKRFRQKRLSVKRAPPS
ncbi:Uncharacterised protein [Vibrio cholerae]|nr:Uncharacterised protein [Vibrio cholerae]